MQVLIRLYASYREQAGRSNIDLDIKDGSIVLDAIQALVKALPTLPENFHPYLIAVNEEFANESYPLNEGDDIALYPPVSGGIDVNVGTGLIDVGVLTEAVRRNHNGALVTFEGTTRDHTGGRQVRYLEYEADERMAFKVMTNILHETMIKFGVAAIAAHHRFGRLEIGEVSLAVATGSTHRHEAYLAGLYVVDRIKHVVPVWKKEYFSDGEVWVGEACDPETHASHLESAPYAGFLLESERETTGASFSKVN
ncbi:MAG: molybdenum cofactor biosynthesis protein D/E [Chloroflexi bacterium]|nr:molybdenum cofactor biosynthesis protein D/E [Chloroflexota bacterium]|tara:strand:- start:684 stop:1442 length:759 start_codon:yes stop_codon:yes gene_type:complete